MCLRDSSNLLLKSYVGHMQSMLPSGVQLLKRVGATRRMADASADVTETVITFTATVYAVGETRITAAKAATDSRQQPLA
jgi:hypothetical protein